MFTYIIFNTINSLFIYNRLYLFSCFYNVFKLIIINGNFLWCSYGFTFSDIGIYVTWSITNGTGQATINTAGRVTAITNGTVTATALAADGSGVSGSLTITLTNQVILISSVSLSTSGGVTSISTDNGQLQVTASILPSNATNNSLTWSVTSLTGRATVNSSGLVTAVDNGTVTATGGGGSAQ